MISRRAFVRNGALALVGTSAIPGFLVRSVLAEQQAAQRTGRKLVVLFQRGAADGLNIVVPYREANYYRMRPSIAIQPGEVLDLDGQFGLHPAMAALAPLYRQGHLAVIHAVGSPDSSRSHFDAQDYMESGTPGLRNTPDGWLNRALQLEPVRPASSTPASAFRAVALGATVPRTLQGRIPATSLSNLQDFAVDPHKRPALATVAAPQTPSLASSALEQMYAGSHDLLLSRQGDQTFDAVRMLAATDPAHYQPAYGAVYPGTPFAGSLRQLAQLLKADLGVEAAFADIGDWDTHQAQGSTQGRLAGRLKEFSEAIAAFWQDMGPEAENITVVTMSEFGRTARQNGTGGTDHGHGNVMFVLGGQVRGGRVYGRWPGLADEQLNEGRDLAITTDFRQVLAEASSHTLGTRDLATLFPGAALSPNSFLRFS